MTNKHKLIILNNCLKQFLLAAQQPKHGILKGEALERESRGRSPLAPPAREKEVVPHMTQREQQILEWIRENPLISQQELADRAGITRSSVGVHIANLMKKGHIKGRGYLVDEESYICVVGAVNVDISGTPDAAYVAGDSNPGHVRITLGGVGRNIAENLCRLGRRVVMITALGDDANAQMVRQGCREAGIDLSQSLTVQDGRTSTYLCLNDEQGEIVGAVSDMGIYEALTPAFLQTRLDIINRAALVVADANLTEEALAFLGENVTVPVFADPVSTPKCRRLNGILKITAGIKPNRPEAALMTGVDIRTDDDLPAAANVFHEMGVRNVFISLGGRGVYFDDGGDRGILPIFAGNIINTNGCGDAFLAAAADGYLMGLSVRDIARRGLAASSLCAQSESAVTPHMSTEALQGILD